MLLVPFGRRRVLGVVVDLAEGSDLPPGAARRADRGARGRAPARAGPARALGRARVLLDAGTRARARAAAGDGDRARPDARRGARPWPRRRPLRERRSTRVGAWTAPASRCSSCSLASEAGIAVSRPRCRGRRPRRASPARAPGTRATERARGPAPPGDPRRRRPARPVALDPAQQRIASSGSSARSTATAVSCCSTASPARARPRSTSRPPRRRSTRGRGAIVLVPEIAMTPQALSRFDSRFGDRVAILHSRLGAGERRDEWRRLRDGEARICVGPRSAVFAPIAGLGLIVVDEEHDASYKQEGDPRYDAREVARRRAGRRRGGARLRLGDAAARELARARAARAAEAGGRPRAARRRGARHARARRARGTASPAHPRGARRARPSATSKGIVLINRRGWSPHLSCRSVRAGLAAARTATSRSSPIATSGLRCHHCGHVEALPESCPECGSVTLARAGAGTERIEADDRGRGRARWRSSGSTPTRAARSGRPPRDPARVRGRAVRRPGRHPDGRQGPRLPRRRARGRPRRRRDPALPRLPRRGADLRARRPARRAQRARRAPAAASWSRRSPRGRRDPPRRRARREPASSPASSSAAASSATRRSRT